MFYCPLHDYGLLDQYSFLSFFLSSLPPLSDSVSELHSLGKDTALLGIWLPTFHTNVMLPQSKIQSCEKNARQNQQRAKYR
jgi:hypothetical protein